MGENKALLALAERCEQATGENAELAALIRAAVFAPKEAFVEQSPFNGAWCVYEIGHNGQKRSWEPRGLSQLQRMGNFTASLDAAMTLVPPCAEGGGRRWAVRLDSGFYGATAELWHECSVSCFHGHASGQHEALARALCAAALRARAS